MARVNQGTGILVLFTSWRLCFQVEELDQSVRDVTLVQGRSHFLQR